MKNIQINFLNEAKRDPGKRAKQASVTPLFIRHIH